MSSSVEFSRGNASTGRGTTLSPTRRERKRASDRMSQQATRARTKAYIERLEKTTRILSEISNENGVGVSKQLKEQYEEIENLKNIIFRIARLANGVEGRSHTAPGTEFKNPLSGDLPHRILHQTNQTIPRDISPVAASGCGGGDSPNTFNPASHPNQESLSVLYPTLNVSCDSKDRDYFQALNQALVMIERSHKCHRFSGPEVDDDINIRAVLHGWDAARAKNPFDIGWQLLQSVDQGLFFRSGSVERIAILRVMRSLFMQKINPNLPPQRRPPPYLNPSPLQAQVEHPRLIDYFVWPEVRDYMIISGIIHAPESLAAQFASDIGLTWPFELRDACNYEVSKGTYTFSKAFNEAYYDLDSWYFKSPFISTYLPPLTPRTSATVAEDKWPETPPQPWNPPFKAPREDDIWNDQWAQMMSL